MLIMRSVLFTFICLGLSFGLAFSAEKKKTSSLKELFKNANNTVVFILAGGKVQGSGVSVKNGNLLTPGTNGTLIVTNAHVAGDFKKVSIVTNKRTEFVGTVVAVDKTSDLALVQIEGIDLQVSPVGSTDVNLGVGDNVFAVGSPKGMSNSLSEGIISGLRQRGLTSVIQTTSAISKGSSGGGLFDRKGRLIGITTFKIIDGENVNFAVHVKHVNDLLNKPIKEVTVNNSDLSLSHIKKGDYYKELKQFDHAITEYSQAIQFDPSSASAYDNRGEAYYELRQFDSAMSDYNQSIRFNPNFEMAYYGRALVYYELKQLERAIVDFDQFIRLNPKLALAYYSRGIAYNDLKQFDRAIADYNQAIRLNPNFAMAYNNRGNTYSHLKLSDRAIADFDQAIHLDPDHATAYNNRGWEYFNIKNREDGCADAIKACDLGMCKLYGIAREKRLCK